MRASKLLSALDDLPYGERVRLIADHALRLRGTTELTALIAELDQGATYERTVGLQLAQIGGEAGHVTKLLADGDPALQLRALAAAGRGVPVPDEALEALYADAPAALRTRLLSVIRRTRRRALAARLIDDQRQLWGDRAAAGLLSSADQATVERLLPKLAHALSHGDWGRLAARHPEPVLGYASRTLPDEAEQKQWWNSVGYGAMDLIDTYPERVLELFRAALPQHELPWAAIKVLGQVADRDPAGLLAILLAPDRAATIRQALTPAVKRRLYPFADEDLIALGRTLWPHVEGVLDELPPSRRSAIFAAITSTVELGQTILSDELLAALPRTDRHEQARRMLALPKVSEDAHTRWRITAHLPYAEAFALLEPEIGRAEADDPAAVYRAVIASAGYSRQPASIGQALTWATRVRNDQDPVRQAVLSTTAYLPPSLLTDDHVVPLQTLLTDALEARDASWGSRSALNQLAETAVRQGALGNQIALLDWGLQAHARLTENTGAVRLYGLIDGLPRGRETAVYEALHPYVEAAAKRREFGLALAIAQAFGRRGWTNVLLHGVLEQAVWSNQEYTVDRAARLWLEPPATRAERTGLIIKREVGMARWDSIWQAVTEVRTDLLDRVLAKPDRIRRFNRNHPAWQVSSTALHRWLPRQHSRYAVLVAGVANDSRMPEWARSKAVSTLGRIPGVGRAAVEPFLSSDLVVLQEAALASLAWTDQPELALPVLLSHAGDDRARVAMYAASRAARFVRPSLLADTFRPVLVGERMKVTSRKEAARLLGVLHAPGAGDVLGEAWASAHRDVRAAIASAASQHLLHEPASWALLQEAVHDSPATATVLVQRSPATMAAQYRSRYADLLIAVTNRPEPEVVRLALVSLSGWARYNSAVAPVCAGFVTDLSIRNQTWSDATTALVAIAAGGRAQDELVSVVRLLVRLESDPNTPNAEPDRDHPARQRLTTVVNRLTAALSARSFETRRSLSLIADELTAPEYLPLRVGLLIYAFQWKTPLAELTAVADLLADRPLAIASAVTQLSTRLTNAQAQWTDTDLLSSATHLTTTGRPVDALLALTLTAAATGRTGWSPTWRALLVALRNHPSADVRHAALDLVTAVEGQ
ncbi:hypothetical protein [Kribbella sp. CA-293567]|uniref:hypothetical protein n=1 Tax=Kribbella sp. CA-293567 TaxID=3002436 RepID=UPI0022DDF0C0|nr:hypothetical protein [Kribbella sp. CA-293567]WBQ03067.1 hypothetical protein OX958_24165 [Kribbella sp. CA-293567]